MKQIFSRNTSYIVLRIVFFVIFALVLLVLDARTGLLKPVRSSFISMSAPMYRMTGLPGRMKQWVDDTFTSRRHLRAENETLKAQNFALQQQLQTMAALIAENARLSELLNASKKISNDVVIANLVGISPDPRRQEMMLDKGSDAGVYVGQAVLDSDGLAGQVIEVSHAECRVLLIVDNESAVPVQILRTGVRSVAEGTGATNEMRLRYVTATTDIIKGDVLVSSGLDRHYPPGYPVATVISVEKNEGQPFLGVRVLPLAQLNRSRHFLLVVDHKGKPG